MSQETPNGTPALGPQTLNQMMDGRTRLPSNRLFGTPRINSLLDTNNVIKYYDSMQDWFSNWKSRIDVMCKETFLAQYTSIMQEPMRCKLYSDAVSLIQNCITTLDIPKDTIKPTLVFYEYMLMCTINDERDRIPTEKLIELISMKEFINSCILCSFITVLVCYSYPIPLYASLLYIFSIQAYDIHRVAETYLSRLTAFKHESLPIEIYNQFNNLMESCIEELIWKHESRIWSYLLAPIETKEGDKQDKLNKDVKPDNEIRPIPRAVEVLIRHLLYISLTRIQLYVNRLPLLEVQREVLITDSYSLFRSVLKSSFAVLEDRHLDSVLLSTLYATSKARGINMSFRILLKVYAELYPQKVDKIKLHVSLAPLRTSIVGDDDSLTSDEGNIIDFYNRIYVVVYHNQLKQYQMEIANSNASLYSTSIMEDTTSQSNASKPHSLVCASPSIFSEAKGLVRSISRGLDNTEPLLSPLPCFPLQSNSNLRKSLLSPHPSILSPSTNKKDKVLTASKTTSNTNEDMKHLTLEKPSSQTSNKSEKSEPIEQSYSQNIIDNKINQEKPVSPSMDQKEMKENSSETTLLNENHKRINEEETTSVKKSK